MKTKFILLLVCTCALLASCTTQSRADRIRNQLLTCDESFGRDTENQLVCNSVIQSMAYDNKVSDSYRLDVVFPAEYNDEKYSELVDYIDLDIASWQKIE